ncbi:hypothetical protein RMCBS344292_09544 [Rhizopus microsporus]|nr:hypothetical protein RMCBS344292_09544 [Rhizopus microsporus]
MRITLFLLFICITTITTIIALPVTTTTSSIEEELLETLDDIEEPSFGVQVDTLSQLIATHLHFDHLDAVIGHTDKEIAMQFRHHIQITIQPTTNTKTSHVQFTLQQLPSIDIMDLEILKSQIFAAIQAHTEGILPLTWDKLADKLSRQAIEQHVRQLLLTTCPSEEQDVIPSQCLNDNAVKLNQDLEQYIMAHLDRVFEALDQYALPDLLQHTAEDLKGILKYFNSVFLSSENRQFVLQVIPWNDDIHHFKSKLLEIASLPSTGEDKSHSTSFFIEFAGMARV